MSGVHLFSADQMAEGHRNPGGFVAVCGEVVRPCGVPHETDTDPTYCPGCVRDAAPLERRGWRSRIESCRPPGLTVKRPLPRDAGSGSAAPPPVAPDPWGVARLLREMSRVFKVYDHVARRTEHAIRESGRGGAGVGMAARSRC